MKTFAIQIITIFFLAACQKKDTTTEPIKEDKNIVTQSNCPIFLDGEFSYPEGVSVIIKDSNFESLFRLSFDSDTTINGLMLASDVLKIDSLVTRGFGTHPIYEKQNIKNMNGIRYFKNLKLLKCMGHSIDTLDLRFNKKLEELQITGFSSPGGWASSQGKVLMLGKNDNLKKIHLSTLLTELDLRGTPNLKELDVQNSYDLKYIYISNANAVQKDWKKPASTVYVVCK